VGLASINRGSTHPTTIRRPSRTPSQAAQLREAINPSRARSADLDRVEELLREAGAIRNRIIGSYLWLVVSIVKKCAGPCQDFFDLVSEGNVSLIRASARFDFARGVRFSTYATWAIINDFARRIPRDRSRRVRFATGREELLQDLTDYRDRDRADTMDQEQSRYMIRKLLGSLDSREKMIIIRRFGFAGDRLFLMPTSEPQGLRPGAIVYARDAAAARPRQRRGLARRSFLGAVECSIRHPEAAIRACAHDAQAAHLARQRA